MQIEIEIHTSTNLAEFKELIYIFEDVFEMENFEIPEDEHLQKLLERENFFAVIAKTDNKIIGGLTVYVLNQYYSKKPLAYIYDLAILTNYHRKGVGKSLIDFTNNYCQQQGFEEVFVQADKVDDYAIDFYHKTKPTAAEEVVHFYYSL